jgi:hypothetical protein
MVNEKFSKYMYLAFKELLIKDWKTTYLHLPEKIMSYVSERSFVWMEYFGYYYWIMDLQSENNMIFLVV